MASPDFPALRRNFAMTAQRNLERVRTAGITDPEEQAAYVRAMQALETLIARYGEMIAAGPRS